MLKESLAPGRLPPGQRLYAIGDIHGCAHRLMALHAAIQADLADAEPAQVTLIYMGDYVDRGPDTALVLDMLLGPTPVPEATRILLKGNHESMMLDACTPGSTSTVVQFWLDNGGQATLDSYDTDPDAPDWRARIPREHLALLQSCALRHAAGDYLFVHAGVRPDVPLEGQDPHDLLWIREPFLSWRGELGAMVVHGHTPAAAPVVKPHRIGIDTGACFGGALTALRLEADRMAFLAV